MYSCVRVVVDGFVQGVGFRYFVLRLAHNLGVNGWVRNRYDGAVEIEAEGQKPALEAFVVEVRIGPRAAHITAVDVVWLPYEGKYKGFDVTY